MSPMMNGYSIYVGGIEPQGQGWIVRAYRDSDDTHIHSAEGCSLGGGLREVETAIARDMARADSLGRKVV